MVKADTIDIGEVLKEVKEILKEIFGNRLKRIILFGSHARGEAVEGSDIDLMILLKDMTDPIAELEKCFEEIHQLDYSYDILISIIPIDTDQYETRRLPIIRAAKKEGIVV